MTMKQLHAGVISHEADVCGAVAVDGNNVAFHRYAGCGVEAWEEGAAVGAVHDLEGVAMKVEGVGAVVVVCDFDFNYGAVREDVGV